MKMLYKRILFTIGFLLFIIFLLTSFFAYNYFSGNVHTVIPGQIYRSGQLNNKQLLKYTKKYHIKTIINLRGIYRNAHWYQVESQFVKAHNIIYYSPWFKSNRLPPKKSLQHLVYLLETVPKPLMFHCEGGADRSGMAAAISYILFKPNASIAQIKRQDSWIYNALLRKSVGHQLLPNYFNYLKQHHQASSKAAFMAWLNSPEKLTPHFETFIWVF